MMLGLCCHVSCFSGLLGSGQEVALVNFLVLACWRMRSLFSQQPGGI